MDLHLLQLSFKEHIFMGKLQAVPGKSRAKVSAAKPSGSMTWVCNKRQPRWSQSHMGGLVWGRMWQKEEKGVEESERASGREKEADSRGGPESVRKKMFPRGGRQVEMGASRLLLTLAPLASSPAPRGLLQSGRRNSGWCVLGWCT